MHHLFLSDHPPTQKSVHPAAASLPFHSDEQERLQLIAMGDRAYVIETIHTLHVQGFAEAGAWSPLLPAPNPGEVMSVLTKYRRRL